MQRIFSTIIILFIYNFLSCEVLTQININDILSEKKFRSGLIRYNNRQYQTAIQEFSESLSYNIYNHKSRFYLGLSFLHSGYTKNAIDELEMIIKLGGGDYKILTILNDLYFRNAIDTNYSMPDSYVFSKYYNGITEGMHKIIRSSFIKYDKEYDTYLISSPTTKYVVEIDSYGNVVRQFGREFGDFSKINLPAGIEIYNTNVYICDYNDDSLHIFTRNGRYIKKITGNIDTNKKSSFSFPSPFKKKEIKQYTESSLFGPMGIVISDEGYMYIVNNGNDLIQKYDLNGNWIQSIGKGLLNRPTDIVYTNGLLYISDTGNKRIAIFDKFGNYISEIKGEYFNEPRGLDLKNNRLYISDSKNGLMIYNLNTRSISKIGVEADNIKYPFDIAIDERGIIYQTDFNTELLAIYSPLELHYNNLNVMISQIWLEDYPNVNIHFRVWDKTGQPVYNLLQDNILVYEEGVEIPLPKIQNTFAYRDRMYIKFIIDKSLNMKEYDKYIKEFLNNFIKNMTGDDWIDLKVVGSSYNTTGRYNASLLWSLDYVDKIEYNGSIPVKMDKYIYDSVSELLNINRNKAIVIITGDDFIPGDYNIEEIKTYALMNAIPIYVINFNEKLLKNYKMLAEKTFGSYYNIADYGKINKLYEEIKNQKPLEYIVSYNAIDFSGFTDYWVNLRLEIKYKGLYGIFSTGYFVPENVKKGIKLPGGKKKIEADVR